MSTIVLVRSHTHSVTYVTDKILKSLKDIIRLSGLDPSKLTMQWTVLALGIRAWIDSGHLERIILEVHDPKTTALVGRWDVEIQYRWTNSESQFWTDTDAIRFAIQKAGVMPNTADYDIKVTTSLGRPNVIGWSSTTLRSTLGMVEQRIGTTVEASGLSGGFSYYRRT